MCVAKNSTFVCGAGRRLKKSSNSKVSRAHANDVISDGNNNKDQTFVIDGK